MKTKILALIIASVFTLMALTGCNVKFSSTTDLGTDETDISVEIPAPKPTPNLTSAPAPKPAQTAPEPEITDKAPAQSPEVQGAELTLASIRQAAENAGYDVHDGMGYTTSDELPIPVPKDGFSIKHEGLTMSIIILEFEPELDAMAYRDYVAESDEHGIHHLRGRFVLEYSPWDNDTFTPEMEKKLLDTLFGG